MDQRYKRYRQEKFKAWKQRVRKRLPEITIAFYQAKLDGKFIDYNKEMNLGRVIDGISDPMSTIMDKTHGKRLDSTLQMTSEIILEIQVQELFKYVANLNNIS